mgnify:CR=1 FL=1
MEAVGAGVEIGGEGERVDTGGVEGGLAAFGDLEASVAEEEGFGGLLGICFWLLGICFWRVAPETAVGPDRRAGKWGLTSACASVGPFSAASAPPISGLPKKIPATTAIATITQPPKKFCFFGFCGRGPMYSIAL